MSKRINSLFDFGTIHGAGFKMVLVFKCFPRLKLEGHRALHFIFQHGVTVFLNRLAF